MTNANQLETIARDISGNLLEIIEILQQKEDLTDRVQELEKDIDFFKKRKRLNDQVIQELAELKDERVRKVLTKVRTVD